MSGAPITDLHLVGWAQEKLLLPLLERIAGEPLEKTSRRYDTIDFEGETTCVELKCRNAYDKNGRLVTANSFDTWLMPATKIDYAKVNKKRTIFVYHFLGCQTTWYIVYRNDLLVGLNVERPVWHSRMSDHYYIPKALWTQWNPDAENVV